MVRRKFFSLLSGFNDYDLKQFSDFIHSPFFNRSQKVVKLYSYIVKFHPDFSSSKLSEEAIHQKLFSNTNYNSSTIRHLFTDLLKLSEKFFVQINLSRRKHDFYDFLLDELNIRNHDELINEHLKVIDNSFSIEDIAGGDHFLNKFRLETERFNYEMSKLPANKKSPQTIVDSITRRNKFLISFFVVEIIKGIDALNLLSHKFEFNNQNNLTSHFLNTFDISKLTLFLKNHQELKSYSFIFDTYNKLFRAFNNIDYEAFYFDYKESVNKHGSKFSRNELAYLNKKLIDYCLLKLKSGKYISNFDEELFNVYENLIINGYYAGSNNNYLSTSLYRNILILALRQKKFTWVETFIDNFLNKLHPSYQKNMYNYSYAMLCFEKKEFENVLEYLNKIKLDNFDMKIDVKNMFVKVYYKLNYFEGVISAISSYGEFLRHNSFISFERRKSHNNFLKFTKNLINVKASKDETKYEYIKSRIVNTTELVSREWLIECIDEIRNFGINTKVKFLRKYPSK